MARPLRFALGCLLLFPAVASANDYYITVPDLKVKPGYIGVIYSNEIRNNLLGLSGCIAPLPVTCYAKGIQYGPAVSIPGSGPGFYQTNVPGIAIRMYYVHPQAGILYFPYNNFSLVGAAGSGFYFHLDIAVYGPVTEGQLTQGRWGEASSIGASVFDWFYINGGRITVEQPTCSFKVGDDNRVVTLPTLPVSTFNGVYTLAGQTDFSISMERCENASTVTFAFKGTPDPIDTWRFRNNGTASGVAVNLKSSADDRDIASANEFNTRTVNIVDGGASLGLRAHYIQTEPTVRPGTVSAMATVTATFN